MMTHQTTRIMHDFTCLFLKSLQIVSELIENIKKSWGSGKLSKASKF